MMGLLEGKVIVITGAGSGLGKETALLFAKEGAKLAICGRHADKMDLVGQELGNSESIFVATADVSREGEVQQFIQATLAKFGRIDVLINNAAVFESYHIADTTLDSWNYHLNNNVTSAFLMTRECIPAMRDQKSGKIISITSTWLLQELLALEPIVPVKPRFKFLCLRLMRKNRQMEL